MNIGMSVLYADFIDFKDILWLYKINNKLYDISIDFL